jgi:hypothetical protein
MADAILSNDVRVNNAIGALGAKIVPQRARKNVIFFKKLKKIFFIKKGGLNHEKREHSNSFSLSYCSFISMVQLQSFPVKINIHRRIG